MRYINLRYLLIIIIIIITIMKGYKIEKSSSHRSGKADSLAPDCDICNSIWQNPDASSLLLLLQLLLLMLVLNVIDTRRDVLVTSRSPRRWLSLRWSISISQLVASIISIRGRSYGCPAIYRLVMHGLKNWRDNYTDTNRVIELLSKINIHVLRITVKRQL